MTTAAVEFLVSLGFGMAAAIAPVFNNEAYVVAALAAGKANAVPVVAGLGLGNGLGKLIVFLLVRAGKKLPWWRALRVGEPAPDVHTWVARWRRWTARLLRGVSDPRWGTPLVIMSAATSVPPIYPMTLLAGATTMRAAWFGVAVTMGSLLRMGLLALATLGVLRLA